MEELWDDKKKQRYLAYFTRIFFVGCCFFYIFTTSNEKQLKPNHIKNDRKTTNRRVRP